MRLGPSYPTFLGDINYSNWGLFLGQIYVEESQFKPTFFKDILIKYRLELYDYSLDIQLYHSLFFILSPCVSKEKVVCPEKQ